MLNSFKRLIKEKIPTVKRCNPLGKCFGNKSCRKSVTFLGHLSNLETMKLYQQQSTLRNYFFNSVLPRTPKTNLNNYTVKKRLTIFPSAAGISLTKLFLAGRVWSVTSRLGTGILLTFFYVAYIAAMRSIKYVFLKYCTAGAGAWGLFFLS
jgi:hypothetical protein